MEGKKKATDIDPEFLAIKSLFESGIIKSMRLLETQSPTKMSRALGINYNAYIDKLQNPEKFTLRLIFKMAKLCDLNPDYIYQLIKDQL